MLNSDILECASCCSAATQRYGDRTGSQVDFAARGVAGPPPIRVAVSAIAASAVDEGPMGGPARFVAGDRPKSYIDWLIHRIDPRRRDLRLRVDAQAKRYTT